MQQCRRRSRADGMHRGITIKYLKGERWIIRDAVDNLNRMNQELAQDNHTRNGGMKIHGIIAMMVAILFATMASAQSPNNAVWGVNDQNQVFRWNSSRNEFEVMPGISLKQVSVGTDGEVWGIDPDDSVYRWTGSQWQQVQGMKLKQLSVRNGQEVWGVDADSHLFRWTGSAWEPTGFTTAFVSAGADGTVWGIGGPGTGDTIQTISDYLNNQTMIALETPGSGHLTRISVTDANRIWAIDDISKLYQRTDFARWQPFRGSNYIDVAQAANGELWTVYRSGTVSFRNGPEDEPMREISSHPLTQIAVGYAGLTIEERQQMLDAHNTERQKYPGVGALQWSTELESWAQDWAQTVASRGGTPSHRQDQRGNPFRPGEGLGENISWWGPSRAATGVDAPVSWIAEKQWYNYEQDSCAPGQVCGHFTQVVWKTHQYVGCGKAISANDMAYYVCNYYPAGNTGGRPY
jgi:pathogenesis-related protein 1